MVTLFTALNVSHDHSLYLSVAALLPLGFLLYRLGKNRREAKRQQGAKSEAQSGATPITDEGAGEDARVRSFKTSEDTSRDESVSPLASRLSSYRLSFFVFFAVFALVVMMAAPLYVYGTQYVPVLRSIRVIVRAGVMFLFAASVLVSFGADFLLDAGMDELKRFHPFARRFFVAVFAFAGLSALASLLIKLSGFITNTNGEYIAGSGRLAYLRSVAAAMTGQFARPGVSILLPLGLLTLVYLLWCWLLKNRISRDQFFVLLVALLIGDLYLNSLQFDKTHDRRQVFPATAITERLKQLPQGRVLVAPSGIETNRKARDTAQEEKIIAPPNTLLPYRISTVTGKDQLFPKAYREFCSLIEPQDHLSHVIFEKNESPYFDALNVKYLLTYETAEIGQSYELLMRADGLALYENKNAMPRAFFVRKMLAPGSMRGAEIPQQMRQPDFDIKTEAVLQDVMMSAQTLSVGEARIIEDQRNRVVIETENSGDGWLVLSDNYYPGWQASIDGQPVEIFRANYTMRAVRVPAGSHVLSFTFAPKVFRGSVYLSLGAGIMVFAALIFLRVKRP
jgi:hypothetical protein